MPEMDEDSVLSELQEMKHRMEILYSQTLGIDENICKGENPDTNSTVDLWEPVVDIGETQAFWIVELDLPGVSEDDLEVEVNDAELSVRGERKTISRGNTLKVTQSERLFGHFARSFRLPPDVRPEAIQASLKGGVLTLTIPKVEKERIPPHKIAVRSE